MEKRLQDHPAKGRRSSVSRQRCFLLLQGVCSPFFARLAQRLQADDHRVVKVNFTGGDLAYWGMKPSWLFRERAEDFQEFLGDRCAASGVTDQILFGDSRRLHREAVDWACGVGIRTHVFEEGYFRPYWITLERGGVNARTQLPRDPLWFRSVGARLPDAGDGEAFASPFRSRAWHDVLYHAAGVLNPLLFPGYRTHAPVAAPIEYAGYLRRFAMLARIGQRELARADQLAAGAAPYYLLPLQLNGDAQIREHSRFRDMREVLEMVMESFARNAPADARLVIKNHPLDPGLMGYAAVIAELERRLALQGRTAFLEAGDLGVLLGRASGVVTVNSTVGSLALRAGCATMALGEAIYDLPGLTFQGSLDEFWQHAAPPDAELFRCFRNTVIHATQINGGFYSRPGIDLAVRHAVPVLLAERSRLDELL
jgi:capsular polysaccharide export protein